MTEEEWLIERHRNQTMVLALLSPGKVQRTKAGKRKLRLFACGCCRLVWDLLTDPRSRKAVEVAELFADGQSSKNELQDAYGSVIGLTYGGYNPADPGVRERTAASMSASATSARAGSAAFDMTTLPVPIAGYRMGDMDGHAILCHLLRCVFGNPFRPIASDPAWTPATAGILARTMYEARDFTAMPLLADLLEEAGCPQAVSDHCRGSGPHVRGCWVVDLLLGKQ